jgi:Mrp family chromosome partitioning ATPase
MRWPRKTGQEGSLNLNPKNDPNHVQFSGATSIILPLVDGSIFTIFFNKVRRKAAQFAAHRLINSNVPNFGAVLNGLNVAVSGYYYAQYYDKSYKDYYVMKSPDERD